MATSDEGHPLGYDLEFEHDLQSTYVGSSLIPGTDPDFVIGFLDSGSDVDLAAGTNADILGLFFPNTVGNTVPVGGVGGDLILAELTMPVGWFAQGLSAVSQSGQLDFSAMVGHSNVCGLVLPPIECGGTEQPIAVMGMPFLAFYNTLINVDTPRRVNVNGEVFSGPDVVIQDPLEELPLYSHFIAMEFGGLSVSATTATYYPDFFDLETPFFPTLLSLFPGTIPTGGLFFTDLVLFEGDPFDPLNEAVTARMLVDTGAQSSIISSAVAANLNLPLNPDFTVSVCGVGGLAEGVPGYYIDAAGISAFGGPLRYARAPFVVLDLPSPEGGILDGILGMNLFWDRNIIFEPSLGGAAFLHVSDPVPFAYGDFNADRDVDANDADWFVACSTPPAFGSVDPECSHMDGDRDLDIDLADFAMFQRCFSGADVFADATCAP